MVPAALVKSMFAMMLFSVVIVAYAQWADVPETGVLIEAPVVQERELTLTGDRQRVYTVRDGDEIVAVSSDPRSGFIGVIGLVVERQRMLRGLTMEAPIRVVERENGNIGIIDDATGESIDLIGYGRDNVAAFAQFLN